MALKPLQAMYPLGQFDGYDTELTSFKGGEVCTFASVLVGSAYDKGSAEVGADGYFGTTNKLRPVVTKVLSSGVRPLFLADDGVFGYGTLFGSVVGGTAGQTGMSAYGVAPAAAYQVGPHTAMGSGKITLWGQPGLYAVTLDAVDSTASTGLTPSNGSLTAGAKLYATTAGLLTPDTSKKFEDVAVARFVDFQTNGSLVTTPNFLTAALNSPSGYGPVQTAFTQAVIWFNGSTT